MSFLGEGRQGRRGRRLNFYTPTEGVAVEECIFSYIEFIGSGCRTWLFRGCTEHFNGGPPHSLRLIRYIDFKKVRSYQKAPRSSPVYLLQTLSVREIGRIYN